MKKFINDADEFVKEALQGLELAHSSLLNVKYDPAFVYRADAPVPNKVALVSGGGSGHEPLHTGFVGVGMLDAACPGEVFTSPSPDQILEATKMVCGEAGVLYIVKNYSGDVMNFEMAAELARARGMNVKVCLVDDDIAVEDSAFTQGRRGVGATVLAEKICGAGAEEGMSLNGLARLCETVNSNARSMGVALTSCVVPMRGSPTFELGPDEIEVGIGIHGERGKYRTTIGPARDIVRDLVEPILDDLPQLSGDSVLAFVNGMGGTPLAELYVVYREVARICEERGIRISRSLVGSYVTSLEMAGVFVTLLKLDEQMGRLWDSPVRTASLRWHA